MTKVIRTCVACGEKKEKRELVRFVMQETPVEDGQQHGHGRGAYVCDNEKCRETGLKRQKIARSLQKNSAKRNRKTG